MIRERDFLRPLPQHGMDLTEVSFPTVDSGGCVTVRTNRYSTPLRPGMKAHAKLLPAYIEIWSEGQVVARHERCYQRQDPAVLWDHYVQLTQIEAAFKCLKSDSAFVDLSSGRTSSGSPHPDGVWPMVGASR